MTDDEIILLFTPLQVALNNMVTLPATSPLLAHYTSIKVMEHILENGEVWFANPLFMNDLQEMRFGLNEGMRIFSKPDLLNKAGGSEHRAAILQHAFARYFQAFDDAGAFDTYIFCLSEHDKTNVDGVLSMWRGYGQHGNGVALVFDAGAVTMVPTSPLIITKVWYESDDNRLKQLEAIVLQWAHITEGANLSDDKLHLAAYSAFWIIKTFALTTKHIGFIEEKEWRVIYYPDRDAAGLLKPFLGYHIGDRGVEPKLKYRIGHIAGVSAPDLTLEKILERIILGPSVSSPLAKRSVERMFDKIGKPQYKPKLHTSSIPLRPVSESSF
jgi:hypothetical protein